MKVLALIVIVFVYLLQLSEQVKGHGTAKAAYLKAYIDKKFNDSQDSRKDFPSLNNLLFRGDEVQSMRNRPSDFNRLPDGGQPAARDVFAVDRAEVLGGVDGSGGYFDEDDDE